MVAFSVYFVAHLLCSTSFSIDILSMLTLVSLGVLFIHYALGRPLAYLPLWNTFLAQCSVAVCANFPLICWPVEQDGLVSRSKAHLRSVPWRDRLR